MVQIITDSSALFTSQQAQELGFEAIPLCVNIGDLEGRDLSIDMNDFYARIKNGQIPKSSQPPVGDVLEMYEKYAGSEIINICMADGLSGTYQSACGVREMASNKDDITVFNTKTLCGPHRYMVLKAQEMKEAGATKDEIMAYLQKAADSSSSFLLPQDFEFLRRGGRLTPAVATLGSMLKLKPVMTLTEDCKRLDKFAIKRTLKAAVGSVVDYYKAKNLNENHILYISHADCLEDAQNAAKQFRDAFPGLQIEILDLSPAFVTQGGPQCFAIQDIEK